MPIGVWQVRENVRNAMKQNRFFSKALLNRFSSLAARFEDSDATVDITGELLKRALFQKKMTDFFRFNPNNKFLKKQLLIFELNLNV